MKVEGSFLNDVGINLKRIMSFQGTRQLLNKKQMLQ